MSETQLRELERRWQATGGFTERVALLRARLRSGTVESSHVSAAALLGDEAAREALSHTGGLMSSKRMASSQSSIFMAAAHLDRYWWLSFCVSAIRLSFPGVGYLKHFLDLAVTYVAESRRGAKPQLMGVQVSVAGRQPYRRIARSLVQLMKPKYDDGAWDLFQHVMWTAADLPRPADQYVDWDDLEKRIRDDHVPRLCGDV